MGAGTVTDSDIDVSVVIPTLNEERFITACLDSVQRNLTQLDARYTAEVIIVDSDSTDATRDLVRNHPVDCRIVSATEGILNARHTGVEAATGDIIVSMDADSTYADRYVQSLIQAVEQPGTVLAYGPCYGEKFLHVDAAARLALQYGLPAVGLAWVSGANRAFEKAAYEQVGGYDLSKDGRSVLKVMYEEQVRFPQRLTAHGDIQFVQEAGAVQSARTLKQMVFAGAKHGGKDWRFIQPYQRITHLLRRDSTTSG